VHFKGPERLGNVSRALQHAKVFTDSAEPKTNVLLWGFTEYVQSGNRSSRDKNFDKSMGAIVDDVKNLVTSQGAKAKP
jgi:hypothetical protein